MFKYCLEIRTYRLEIPQYIKYTVGMGLFYTGKGDGGESVVGSKKIDKTGVEIYALGELDELNSLIGIVKNIKINTGFKKILHDVQENLFIVQANLANIMLGGKYKSPQLSFDKVREMEKIIDKLEKKLKPAKAFVISGSSISSAWLDYTRAVSRRVERSVLSFGKYNDLSPEIKAYLNRLSSLFFAMARFESKSGRKKEKHPKYK